MIERKAIVLWQQKNINLMLFSFKTDFKDWKISRIYL